MIITVKDDYPKDIDEHYIVLELDTFNVEGKEVIARAILQYDDVPLSSLENPGIDHWRKLHADLIHGYKTQQFNFCDDLIGYMFGKFGSGMDTFYADYQERIQGNIMTPSPPGHEWTYVVSKPIGMIDES